MSAAHARLDGRTAPRTTVTSSSPAISATPSAPAASASSALNAAPTPFNLDSLPLRDQAFLLYCDGLRSPAIAERLHIPERTVRAWIAATLDESDQVRRAVRHEALERAITRLQAAAQAAWDAFERIADADDRALTDRLLYSATAAVPQFSPLGPRYLAVALAAERELARLLHLSDLTADDETALALAAQSVLAAEAAVAAGDAEVAAAAAALHAQAAARRATPPASPMPSPSSPASAPPAAARAAASAPPAAAHAPAPPSRPAPAPSASVSSLSSVVQSAGPAKSARPSPAALCFNSASSASSAVESASVPSPDVLARMAAVLDRRSCPAAPALSRSGG